MSVEDFRDRHRHLATSVRISSYSTQHLSSAYTHTPTQKGGSERLRERYVKIDILADRRGCDTWIVILIAL